MCSVGEVTVHRVVLPPRVYFDTAFVIDLAAVQREGKIYRASDPSGRLADSYRRLLAWSARGLITPVFCHMSAYEWLNNGREKALAYAGVFDAAADLMLVEFDMVVMLAECLSEAHRVFGISKVDALRPISRFRDPRDGMNQLGRWFSDELDSPEDAIGLRPVAISSVRREVELLASSSRRLPNLLQESAQVWIAKLDARCSAQELYRSMDLDRCPGLSLWTTCHWRFVRSRERPKINDLHDLALAAMLPYVDAAIVDARMVEFVRSSKLVRAPFVTNNPTDFVMHLAEVLGPAS
jgi:hypothetical protein